jgi:hypothetical protein
MPSKRYGLYFELEDYLQTDPSLVPHADLYNFDDRLIYAAILDRLAQPLPEGQPSPFSSKAPGTAHAQLVSSLTYLQGIAAHECNLTPDAALLTWLRLLGTRLREAEYSSINVRFTRSVDAIAEGIPVTIPLGTEVRSYYDSARSVYTKVETVIPATQASVLVPCRFGQIGQMPTVIDGEFATLPGLLTYIGSVASEGEVIQGREPESIVEAVLRTRDWLKTGDRCVTDRDYAFFSRQAGAAKVNVIRGQNPAPGVEGLYRDLRAIAVYPETAVGMAEAAIRPRTMADLRLTVIPAEIIPLSGEIKVKALESLSNSDVFTMAATAIAQNINPPASGGVWGDKDFISTLSDVIERTQGIYAVTKVDLKHSLTGQPLSDMSPKPWQLFEIQQDTVVTIEGR